MQAKVKAVMTDLNTTTSEMEEKYNSGVVDGFTKQPLC